MLKYAIIFFNLGCTDQLQPGARVLGFLYAR